MSKSLVRSVLLLSVLSVFIAVIGEYIEPDATASSLAAVGGLQSPPNIQVNGYTSTDKVQRGRLIQGAIVMDIPGGFHINSNRPLEKFLVATQLTVEAPQGVKVGAVSFPRALMKTFQFSKDKLSVYEGRVILRFSAMVPANFSGGSMQLKTKLRYQSCSDSLCFPPQTREIKLDVPVVGMNESVKRVNSQIFGGRR
jgi:DsbC/DsbD-like thiol-disulfide interchange protein